MIFSLQDQLTSKICQGWKVPVFLPVSLQTSQDFIFGIGSLGTCFGCVQLFLLMDTEALLTFLPGAGTQENRTLPPPAAHQAFWNNSLPGDTPSGGFTHVFPMCFHIVMENIWLSHSRARASCRLQEGVTGPRQGQPLPGPHSVWWLSVTKGLVTPFLALFSPRWPPPDDGRGAQM